MRRQAALVALLAATLTSPGAGAATTDPGIVRLSFDPVPGDYTMLVRVDNFRLVAPNVSAPSQPGEGHLAYLLDGEPCTADCAQGKPYLTNLTAFTYHRRVVGNNLTVELRYNNGTVVQVPVLVDNKTVMRPVQHTVTVSKTVARPSVAITSGIPNAGDYTMTLRVERFLLAQPGGNDTPEVDTGHILYTYNGRPCSEECAQGNDAATASTSFTFHDVKVGDRLGAELVRPDGDLLAPRQVATVFVAKPAIRITSGVAQEGDYLMRVNVTGFTLQAPDGKPNAGTGHILYMVKREGMSDFTFATCPLRVAATASTTYTFCDLKEGDLVTAELVSTKGEPLQPPAVAPPMEVKRRPEEPFLSPGVGPLVGVLLVALAAAFRSKQD